MLVEQLIQNSARRKPKVIKEKNNTKSGDQTELLGYAADIL